MPSRRKSDEPESWNLMNTDERDRFITAKLNQGMGLSEVQKLLTEQGVTMTYLDLRLLAAELEVNWKKQDLEQEKLRKPAKEEAAPVEATLVDDEEDGGGFSSTRITVSKVVRPGASMSGEVEFASGAKGEWYIDAYGRLGLVPRPGSSRPTEEDIQDFQVELQHKLGGG